MYECVKLRILCHLIVFFFVLLATTNVATKQLKSPAVDFHTHSIVRPIAHHGRTKREIRSTSDVAGEHHKEVMVTVPVRGERYELRLRLNERLVPAGHVLAVQSNGRTVLTTPSKEELDICQYSGTVRGKPGSWVAVSTCRGVRGVIHDGSSMKYIEPAGADADVSIDSDHYIYDHADLSVQRRCGYAGGVTNNASYDAELLSRHRRKQSLRSAQPARRKREADEAEARAVRAPYNANRQSRYVELALVADRREFRASGDSVRALHRALKDVANIINSLYEPLNIFIALVGVVIWTERDKIDLHEDGDRTLTNFLHYRKSVLLKDIPNDNAQLLTRQRFQDGVVGKALKGPICTSEFSGGVATNHSAVIGLVATNIAHLMGHNFGMEHDTEECSCPDERCIMDPSVTSVAPTHWSSCSLASLALAFERGMDYCLRNEPKSLFVSPTCGNGFVEAGEQCDCGLGGGGACAACCDPHTCTLRVNATCAAGACCDRTTCRPAAAGTECRAAERECDLPEYCSGHSEYCPADVHRMDASPCVGGQAYCVRGACRSHSDQCRLLWGSTGESANELCYTTNVKGNRHGNCGYRRGGDAGEPQYARCAAADALCGLLQCRHLNERLEFGMESVSQLSAMFINNNGTVFPCRTAMVDLGLSDVDPGLVPDGAKCGEDKMCLNQKCVSVETVRVQIAGFEESVCPSDCSGHGSCNSKGHCHCEVGFAPPLCALPGAGGSYDSGPASDITKTTVIPFYYNNMLPRVKK